MEAKELFTRVRSGFSAVEEAGFVLMRDLPTASDQKFRSWPIGKHFCRDSIMTMRFFHSTLPPRMSDYEQGSTDSVDLNYPQSAAEQPGSRDYRCPVKLNCRYNVKINSNSSPLDVLVI